LGLIRSWLVRLPDEALRKELEAFLAPAAAANLREGIEAIGNIDLKRSLQTLLSQAGDDIGRARAEVEDWFNQAMVRVSGWYKRRAQFLLIIISIPVVAGLNADTITMITSLCRIRPSATSLCSERSRLRSLQRRPLE
jgi:hypothetical protein